jgi:hypothetical protein
MVQDRDQKWTSKPSGSIKGHVSIFAVLMEFDFLTLHSSAVVSSGLWITLRRSYYHDCSTVGWRTNDDLEMIWKESVAT